MEEKVGQQTETRDMTERVEEMLSAIDAACTEIDRQTQGEPALTPELVADVGAQLASDPTTGNSIGPEPAGSTDAGVLNPEQSELADADAGFVLEDLIEPSEPEQAVNAAAEALHNAVESAENLSDDLAAIAGALTDLNADEGEPEPVAADDEPQPAAAPGSEILTPAVGEPTDATSPQSIEELDSELASLADAALDGEFEDAAGLQTESSAPPVNAGLQPTGAPVQPDAPPDPEAPVDAPRSPESASGPEPGPQPVRPPPTTSPPPGVQPEPEPPEPSVHLEPPVTASTPTLVSAVPAPGRGRFAAVAGVARVLEPGARKAWLAARPTLASAVIAIGKPTQKLSTSKRDTIGWFAVYTAFLAVCVWGFLLLFRKPSVPTPTTDPVGILGEQPAPTDS